MLTNCATEEIKSSPILPLLLPPLVYVACAVMSECYCIRCAVLPSVLSEDRCVSTNSTDIIWQHRNIT